jgi:putative ABC transport system ATP-binding protein
VIFLHYTFETKDLCKTYGEKVKTQALCGVSLNVAKGEFVSIIGPSGSGKSTLLNLIGTLDRPTSGKLSIDGIDTSKLNDTQLAKLRNEKIGFVFQSFNLIQRMNAFKNVELPLLVKNISNKERFSRTKKWLNEVGLIDKFKRKPLELSGGEQQRVALARALVTDPSILLGDEPTGNLDTKNTAMIVDILKKLNESTGKTFIIITHNLEVARKTKRIIYIRDGLIEKEEYL